MDKVRIDIVDKLESEKCFERNWPNDNVRYIVLDRVLNQLENLSNNYNNFQITE